MKNQKFTLSMYLVDAENPAINNHDDAELRRHVAPGETIIVFRSWDTDDLFHVAIKMNPETVDERTMIKIHEVLTTNDEYRDPMVVHHHSYQDRLYFYPPLSESDEKFFAD